MRRHWHVQISAVATLLLVFFGARGTLARIAWEDYRQASLALVLNRNDAGMAFEIGNYYFNGGAYDLARAERAYARALALDPARSGPRYQLARIAFLRSDFTSALAFINEEIALHPDFTRAHYVRGLIHGYARRFSEAEADFSAFLEWKPQSWAGRNDLAWIYFAQGKFAEAEEEARIGLSFSPENPWLLTSRGTALINLDRGWEAEAVLAKALDAANQLSIEEWGRAYPGNDPALYPRGLTEMRRVIEANLALARR